MCLNGWGGKLHEEILPYIEHTSPDILCLQEVVHSPETDKDWLTYRDGDHILPQRANFFRDVCHVLPEHVAFFSLRRRVSCGMTINLFLHNGAWRRLFIAPFLSSDRRRVLCTKTFHRKDMASIPGRATRMVFVSMTMKQIAL